MHETCAMRRVIQSLFPHTRTTSTAASDTAASVAADGHSPITPSSPSPIPPTLIPLHVASPGWLRAGRLSTGFGTDKVEVGHGLGLNPEP